MSATQSQAATARLLHPGLLAAIRVSAGLALGFSAYLAWLALSGGRPVGCGPESGCDRVLHSRWAYWFGVPVSLFAVATYMVILAASWQRATWTFLKPTALLILGAVIWFVALQVLVVKSLCAYCLAAHAAGGLAALCILLACRSAIASDPSVLNRSRRGTVLAILGLTALVAGQVVYRPPTYRETTQAEIVAKFVPDASTGSMARPSPPPARPASAPSTVVPVASAPAPTGRVFPVYQGRFNLEVNDLPVIGSPTNEHVVVSLFDYTCHHCREMHERLVEAQRLFSNRVVIVSLPMPLDPACNHLVTRTAPDHTNACAYARLGLAVWRAAPSRHHEFDAWLFTGPLPPPLDAALERARQLAGAAALEKAAADPAVEAQLKLGISIYELAYRSGQGSMPQLIVGSTVAVGSYPPGELTKLLADKLGLNPPATGTP